MMRRLFSGLVTSRPPKEVKGKMMESSLQELSASKPTLMVPQEDNPVAERERLALLLDAAITPPDMPGAYGIPSWALDTGRLMRAFSVAKKAGILPPANVLTEAEQMELGKALANYMHTPAQYKAAAAKLQLATGCNLGQEKLLSQPVDTWEDVIELASKLAEEAKRERPVKQPKGSGEGDSDEDEGEYGDGTPESGEEAYESSDGDGRKPKYRGDPWSPSFIPKQKDDNTRPGKLENADKPDTLPMRSARKLGMRKRPELEGAIPSAWHRLYLDGKIFKGAPMKGGSKGRGTILVDMSSSMSWSRRDFEELLNAVPECTVFGYAGQDTIGRIVLLADRGRVADINHVEKWKGRIGGSNVVDVPALKLLSKMPKPRIWLSDGGATGCHDKRTPYIIDLVGEVCERGSIVRVRTARQAAKYILTGKCEGAYIGANARHCS